MSEHLRNWAGNVTFQARALHRPETITQVQEIVRGSGKLRVLGSGHSFSPIADSTRDLLCLDRLAPTFALDPEQHTATVTAGITYSELCPHLDGAGYALPNTASLPHITVMGACSTATHGSGVGNRCLATSVRALEFVAADGSLVTLTRAQHGDQFAGAVVSLGGLGVITRVTLDLLPRFVIRQTVYENLPWVNLEAHFAAIMGSAYSVSLFTDWQGERINQTWVKDRVSEGAPAAPVPDYFGATPATRDLHPLPILSASNCTPQMGVSGPWYERLPHFQIAGRPSNGDELQSEYFVPRAHAVAALQALNAMRTEIAPQLQMSEVRAIAADDLWMSPFFERDSVALHFTWKNDWEGVRALLPRLEAALAPFEPTPHWGKLFTMLAGAVQARYAKLPQFQALLRTYDPEGKFRNPFLDTYIFG